MANVPTPTLTLPHAESGTATTLGGIVGGALSATLSAKWPEYKELWIALGTVATVLVGFGLKWLNKPKAGG